MPMQRQNIAKKQKKENINYKLLGNYISYYFCKIDIKILIYVYM